MGSITTPYAVTLTPGESSDSVWSVSSPFNRPGVLRLRTLTSAQLSSSVEGIYTCTIPTAMGLQYPLMSGCMPMGSMVSSYLTGSYSYGFNGKYLNEDPD